MTRRTHIVGAGLAGLSAAVRLAEAGHRVTLYEAGPQAGGRCRSYDDEMLGCRIDNGNHLLLSGNRRAFAYLKTIGADTTLAGADEARFPFIDLATGERWILAPGRSRLPLWLFDPKRRVPGTSVRDYLRLLKLARASEDDTVAGILAETGTLFPRLWAPLAVSILNTEAANASARLFWTVIKETLGRGGDSCMPRIAREGLSESFVDPALAWLKLRGAQLHTGIRVKSLLLTDDCAEALETTAGRYPIETGDGLVLAVPPAVAASLLPGLIVPSEYRPILNAHFVLPIENDGAIELMGVVGGTAEWLFRRGNLISVTVSAALDLMDAAPEALAAKLWREIQQAFGLDLPLPRYRIVKERRATIAQTPAQLRRRPAARTRWPSIALAGDWTATGLPATIEGAIASGEEAARSILAATKPQK